MNKAVFLDRDGVINRKAPEGQYITRWQDLELLPGAADAIAALNQAGFRVIVVTNQRCVAKGLLTTQELEAIHTRMLQDLAAAGAVITAIYYCPHDTDPPCSCRKPSPSMLLAAARDHDIELNASWMVGDSRIDIEAGKRAGCKTVRITASTLAEAGNPDIALTHSLLDATRQIVAESSGPATRET